ncbi:MAG: UDP-3-O-(3-hydroxymyristoyl)glucosamine N-acyltransferase [Myxococcota bacterium]
MTTVGALAGMVDGAVIGDATREIRGVADLTSAGPNDITFLANAKYASKVATTRAGAVIVIKALEAAPCAQLVCANPYLAMQTIAQHLNPAPKYSAGAEAGAFVHPDARLHPTAVVRAGAVVEAGAVIGERTIIEPLAYVGRDAKVGADCLLHPGAKVMNRCELGDRVIIQPNGVVGSDGFGYAPDAAGKRHKIPQVGIAILEDDVEIGANSTIDRATFGVTRIGKGTKIDNLVQIGHNVVTGSDCVIVSQSGVAGSTTLGDRVVMGAQTGVTGHVTIASDVTLAARAAAAGRIAAAGVYGGIPAIPHPKWVKSMAVVAMLPELRKRVRELERKILGNGPASNGGPNEKFSSAEGVDGDSSDSNRS